VKPNETRREKRTKAQGKIRKKKNETKLGKVGLYGTEKERGIEVEERRRENEARRDENTDTPSCTEDPGPPFPTPST